MLGQNEIREITEKVVAEFKKLYGSRLVKVVLFGSYARGDYDEESDIDIVAIVGCDRETIAKDAGSIAHFASDISLKYGITVSPMAIPGDDFERLRDDLPFYTNIANEGVVLSA